MADIKDLYGSVTRQAPQQRDPLERQHARQRRSVRNRKLGAFTVAAVIVLGLAWLVRPQAVAPTIPAIPPTLAPLPPLAPASYTLDVRTGVATPFVRADGGYAWAPSPIDPERYAFNKEDEAGRQVWVEGADEPRSLTEFPFSSAPAWSPDGEWLLFSAGGGALTSQIYVANVETGRVSTLTDEPRNGSAPSWSPDGTSILYAAGRKGEVVEGLPFYPVYFIVRRLEVTVDGDRMTAGPATTVIGDQAAPADTPITSPDATRMAYVRMAGATYDVDVDASLWLLDLGSGVSTRLVPALNGLSDPRWSPDGRTISFKVEGEAGPEAWTVDAETGEVRRLSLGYPFSWADEDTVHIDVPAPESPLFPEEA